MVNFVLKRPVFITIIYLLLLIFGIFAIRNIEIDLLPEVSGPKISIITYLPYTSPETIETRITSKIEEIVWRISGVKKTISRSSYGDSEVEVEFLKGTNVRFAQFLIKEEIASFRKDLPMEVWGPYVVRSVPEKLREKRRDFFKFQVISSMDINHLREFVIKNIVPTISSMYGVSLVKTFGGSEPVVKIILNRKKMKEYGITLSTVLNSIYLLQMKPVSVSIEKRGDREIILAGKIGISLKDMKKLPVSNSGGKVIPLSRVANIYRSYGMLHSLSRVNGMDALTLSVEKNRDANAVELSEKVRKKLEELGKRFPGIKFKILVDSGRNIEEKINKLFEKAGYIFLFVFLSLVIFLFSLRTPFIVILSILFSTVFTVDIFFLMGMSINLITLSGLALGFGMIVDNSIVVGESIVDYLVKGWGRREAVIRGTKSVMGSVFASTLTTIGVFFSFVFITGRMSAYYLPFVYSVVIALFSSMIIAFTLIPLLFYKTGAGSRGKYLLRFDFLRAPLRILTKGWIVVILIFVYIFYFSYGKFRDEVPKGEFGWSVKNDVLYLSINMPGECKISTISDILTPIEREVIGNSCVKEEVLTIYKKGALMMVKFKDEYKNTLLPLRLKNKLISLVSPLAGITVSVFGIDNKSYYSSPEGVGGSFNSEIKVGGYVFEKVRKIAKYIKDLALRGSRRVKEAIITYDRRVFFKKGEKEYVIVLNRDFISKHGIDIVKLLFFISANLNTEYNLKVMYEGDELPLVVRFSGGKAFTPDEFYDLIFKLGEKSFKLKELLKIEEVRMGGVIVKENQKYTARVMWNYMGSYRAGKRYLEKVFDEIQLPPGYTKSLGSDFMTEEEKKIIYRGYFIAVFIIFLILASYFESFYYPFLVMFSIIFSLVGVFLIFWIGKYTFDSSAYIALILIFGIVVNDAILYVDHYRESNGCAPEEASIKRIRSMLLTTLTTVVGMLPLIIGGEKNVQDVWKSLGIATVGGLLSSTFFTILFMPSFVVMGENVKKFTSLLGKTLLKGLVEGIELKGVRRRKL